jgi:hypothetical protein
MSDLKSDDGKQAVYCLEHLLYEVPFSALHNMAALLAQETNQPVGDFGQSDGHWSFEVVQRFLHERGMRCILAYRDKFWLIDTSANYLRRYPGFIGIICSKTLESYKWDGQWLNSKKEVLKDFPCHLDGDCYIVHQMWSSVENFYKENKPFYIASDGMGLTRYECYPESCWKKELINYDGRSTAVKTYMKEHRRGPIMMSNEHEIVLCKPGKNGWKTETLLNYECFDIQQASQRVLNVLDIKVGDLLEAKEETSAVMSHAMYSVLSYMGGRLTPQECSSLNPEEIEILKKYEQGLLKLNKKK